VTALDPLNAAAVTARKRRSASKQQSAVSAGARSLR
jgi:hypothetical protein